MNTTNPNTATPPMPDKTWTLGELCEYLQITERTGQRLLAMQQLPCLRVGHSYRFSPRTIAALVATGGVLLTFPAKPQTTCAENPR